MSSLPPFAAAPATPASWLTQVRLGGWGVYFVAKLVLFALGLLNFHALENLGLAAWLLWPRRSVAQQRLRALLAWPAALALLYYDSWLFAGADWARQWALVQQFSWAYWQELIGRVWRWDWAALALVGTLAYHTLSRYLRLGLAVTLALLAVSVWQAWPEDGASPSSTASTGAGAPRSHDPDALLAAFYASEKPRRVNLAAPAAGAPPFDIVVIHVCSLAWDDLQLTQLDGHPVFAGMDFLFTRFNTATAYSGPAAARVLRMQCGQTAHAGLFQPAPECALFANLQSIGFTPQWLMNHDGQFEDFLNLVRVNGGFTQPPLANSSLPVGSRAFDGSPVYDDLAALRRWLHQREQLPAERVALYYNTITLHDGNRAADAPKGLDTQGSYRYRARRLLDQLQGFVAELRQSGRRVVLVLAPEHGAALRGDALQFSGLREIPTPAITLGPAAIKLIGPGHAEPTEPVRISEPTSFLALSHLLAGLLQDSPYQANANPRRYLTGLPATRLVSENENFIMMEDQEEYWMKARGQSWQTWSH